MTVRHVSEFWVRVGYVIRFFENFHQTQTGKTLAELKDEGIYKSVQEIISHSSGD